MAKRTSKSRRPAANAPLRIESLESKQMLAGDVFVSVVDGALEIRGDELDNQIAITAAESPGSYLIRGLRGTVVRQVGDDGPARPSPARPTPESPESGVVVEGVRGNVSVRMGDGDDFVRIDDAAFRGSVRIGTGDGADTVLIGTPTPDRDPAPEPLTADSLAAGESDDTTPTRTRSGVRIGGSLAIATGDASDNVAVGDVRVGRALYVATGDGDDVVRLGEPMRPDMPVADADNGEATERMRPDPAVLHGGYLTRVSLGDGDDRLLADSIQARRFQVAGGEGTDNLRVQDTVASAIALWAGRGDAADEVQVDNVRSRRMAIVTGGGDDAVQVTDSAFGLLAVDLGRGDDRLAMAGVAARGAFLNGGPGEADALREADNNRIQRKLVRGFEFPLEDRLEEDRPTR